MQLSLVQVQIILVLRLNKIAQLTNLLVSKKLHIYVCHKVTMSMRICPGNVIQLLLVLHDLTCQFHRTAHKLEKSSLRCLKN